LLQLNKDNEELREKRTTLEALLVLEREDMADLQKAHTDLQASLVEVATEKQQLVPHSLPHFFISLLCSSLPHTRHDTRHDTRRNTRIPNGIERGHGPAEGVGGAIAAGEDQPLRRAEDDGVRPSRL
jgi:hypothetical protein